MAILFNNARVLKKGHFFPNQKVLVEGSTINIVGSSILKGAEVNIDCESKYLIPGLIDAHTHFGLAEAGDASFDLNEDEYCITPQLRPLDGLRMHSRALEDARRAGVTTCMVCPGSDLPIGGACSILKTSGNSADVGLIIEQAGILFSFGDEPKKKANQCSFESCTRMGLYSLMRETLMKAQDYNQAKQSKKKILKDREIEMEALIPLIRREVPMRACAHRAEDIMAAIRLAEEFELDLIIEHGTEAHLVADVLAAKHIPVVLGPALMPKLRNELTEQTFESAKILSDAGVDIALTCDFPGLPIETLRVAAAMSVQYGLDEKTALAAITSSPAKIMGIDDQTGSIQKGYDADLALFSGHPLDIRSRLEALVIGGELFTFSKDLVIESEAN